MFKVGDIVTLTPYKIKYLNDYWKRIKEDISFDCEYRITYIGNQKDIWCQLSPLNSYISEFAKINIGDIFDGEIAVKIKYIIPKIKSFEELMYQEMLKLLNPKISITPGAIITIDEICEQENAHA